MNYINSIKTLGLRKTYERMYMFRQLKEGNLVGSDELGNKYYENLSLPYGQHRWVEPKNYDVASLIEATNIAPQWHRWLHYTTDDVPVDDWKNKFNPSNASTGESNVIFEKSDTPNKHHYNQKANLAPRPNPTIKRERGYNIGSYYSAPFENGYYTQPGHPLNPYHKDYSMKKGTNASTWDPNDGKKVTNNSYAPAWKKYLEQRELMTKKEIESMTSTKKA